MLEIKNVKKSYYLGKQEFPVLKGISFTIKKGEFVSVLGESGGGKSTLMNIIGGLDNRYKGDIILDGKSQKNLKSRQIDQYRRETIGFIFQSFNLINYLSVLDNVMVSLKMTTLSHKEQVKRAEELLEQVGITEHKHKKPSLLSGGQKQRVAIARALASNPDILIADEPTGALDAANSKDVLELLQDIAKSGKTVLVVTHSQEVANAGTRIIKLEDGRILTDEQLKEPYAKTQEQKQIKSKPLSAWSSLKTAFAHFRNVWKQNLIITIGMAIGLFAVIFFLGLGKGAADYMNGIVKDFGNPNTFQVTTKNLTVDNQDAKAMKKLKNVVKVHKDYYYSSFNAVFDGKTTTQTTLQTVNDSVVKSAISNKKYPNNKQIVVSKEFAVKQYGKKDYKKVIGKTITIAIPAKNKAGQVVMVNQSYTVSGTTASQFVVTATSLNKAAKSVDVQLTPVFLTMTVNNVKNTNTAIKAAKAIKEKEKGKAKYQLVGASQASELISPITFIVSTVLAIIAGISLIVSIFMIVATTYMSVASRTKEIGILRALGSRKKDIRRLFINESLFIGLSSSIVAIILAIIVQVAVNKATHPTINANIIHITIGYAILAIILSIIISLIASLAPAGKASRLNPIDALASE